MRVRSAGIIAAVCLLLALLAGQSAACSTPVYRDAMLNWTPAPYRFYYLHDGQISEQQAAVNRLLDGLASAEPTTTNMMFRSVNTSDQEQMDLTAGLVKRAWESHDQTTMHLVMTPWGHELFAGELDEKVVREMIDSPLRQRVCKLLDEGKTGVLLLVKSDDEAENKRAEKVITDALAEIAESARSEVVSPDPPNDPNSPSSPDLPNDGDFPGNVDPPNNVDVAVVTVSRTDPAEQWLVRILLLVDDDLNDPEFASSAMVFAVLGRGKVMSPYVGRGISGENMINYAMDMTVPCSCTSESNLQGKDLLMQWDWSATAERMAEDSQVEEDPTVVALPAMAAPVAEVLLQTDIATETEKNAPERFTFRILWLFTAALAAATTLVLSIGYVLARGRRM
jgi:hypothetical protein